ncbi:phage major capsid protein, partial [Escherichia coli]
QALDLQSLEKTSLAISVKETEGEWWTSFRGVPIRETDALLETCDSGNGLRVRV